MKTSHREWLSGHTAAILQEIPAMICDGLRCFEEPKIAANCPISSQRVVEPMDEYKGPATRCDEIDHFPAILKLLEPSQTIAAHRRYLLQNRSSVASQLPRWNVFIFSCDAHRIDSV